jgi:hypothetical protein
MAPGRCSRGDLSDAAKLALNCAQIPNAARIGRQPAAPASAKKATLPECDDF